MCFWIWHLFAALGEFLNCLSLSLNRLKRLSAILLLKQLFFLLLEVCFALLNFCVFLIYSLLWVGLPLMLHFKQHFQLRIVFPLKLQQSLWAHITLAGRQLADLWLRLYVVCVVLKLQHKIYVRWCLRVFALNYFQGLVSVDVPGIDQVCYDNGGATRDTLFHTANVNFLFSKFTVAWRCAGKRGGRRWRRRVSGLGLEGSAILGALAAAPPGGIAEPGDGAHLKGEEGHPPAQPDASSALRARIVLWPMDPFPQEKGEREKNQISWSHKYKLGPAAVRLKREIYLIAMNEDFPLILEYFCDIVNDDLYDQEQVRGPIVEDINV